MKSASRSVALIALAGALVSATTAQADAKSAAADGQPAAYSGQGSWAAASGMPCGVTIARSLAGKQLRFGLVCAASQVVIARFDFPRSVKLVGQRPFGGGRCSGTGTNIWYCIFPSGIPSNTQLTGVLRLKKRSAAEASVRATYFTSSTIGTATLDLDPGRTELLTY